MLYIKLSDINSLNWIMQCKFFITFLPFFCFLSRKGRKNPNSFQHVGGLMMVFHVPPKFEVGWEGWEEKPSVFCDPRTKWQFPWVEVWHNHRFSSPYQYSKTPVPALYKCFVVYFYFNFKQNMVLHLKPRWLQRTSLQEDTVIVSKHISKGFWRFCVETDLRWAVLVLPDQWF